METKASLSAARTSRGSKRCLAAAVIVFLTGVLFGAIGQAQILGTGQLNSARRGHTATLLQDGKIFVVGGDDANGLVGQAEILDPVSLTSSNIAANPIAPRTDHTATLLADGRVLIIGGVDQNGLMGSTEFYNPYAVPAPSFSAGASLMRPRSGHTATLLSDGKILIVGGEATGSAEIYDPSTQTGSLVSGHLNTPRQYHSAALLNSGKVLIAGGVVGTSTTLTSAEIYDPQTQTFTPASGPMQTPRGLALLRVLPDGKVQVIGGDGEFSMEMFDSATNSFIALAHVPPHEDYLNNILASRTRSALISTIIQQNPVLQGQPELTPEIIALLNRLDHTVTEIPQSNRTVIAGGVNDAGQILNLATAVSSSGAMVTTDKFDYAPGEIVTITGNGFQPNETVWMLFHEEPETHGDVVISSVASSQGNFTNADFAPATADANRSFTLTAIGQSSGFTTQTAFKDAPRIASVSVGAQTGTLTFGTVGNATYTVTPVRGNNGTVNGTLSVISGLPAGVTAAFSPSSGTWTSNGGTAFPSFTLTLTTSATTPAGTFTFTVKAADGSDQATNTGTLTIGKATPTITWNNPADITYGTALSSTQLNATSSVAGSFVYTPASGTVLNAGNGQTLHVDFTPTDTANYNNASKNVSINVLKATPTINWSNPADITYGTALSGTQLNATASAIVNGSTVTVVGVFTYTPVSGTVLNAANGQNLHVSFAPTDTTNYNTPVTKDVTINVLKKDATWTTDPNSKTYGDADPVPLTTGSGSGFLAADGVTATYSRAAGEAASPPTYHITATSSATVSGALNNYNITNTGAEFTINKRNATWTTNANSKTYGDSDPSPLTTGSGSGFVASDNVTATYSRTAGETVAGSPYHITATLSPAGVLGNYTITNAGADFTISAKAASVTPNASSKTYGDTDPAFTGTLVGFLAADGVTATYSRTVGENVAGSPYTISATLSPGGVLGNYNITYNTANFTINKANAICTVNGYTGIYDSAPHGATGSCKGVDGTTVLAGLDLGASFTNVPGGTASWLFTDVTGNYNDQSGSVAVVINKADATITVNGYTGVYDGNPHGASGTATGVGGVDLNGSLNLGSTFTNVPGGTAHWTFSGGTNYNDARGDVAIVINRVNATINVAGYTGVYDGNAHGASGSATGIGGAVLTGSLNLGATFTDAPGGMVHWTFSGGTNYNDAGGDVAIVINQATPTVSVTGGTFIDDAQPHGAIGFAYGIGGVGDVLSPTLTFSYTGTGSTIYGPTGSAPSTPGTYLATAIFAGNQNYTGASNSDSITIKNAAPQAKDQSVATNEDVPLPITLRARDLDSSSLNFIITSGPTNGTLGSITTDCTPLPIAPGAMSCTGTVTYSPNQDYNGADSFKLKINDGELDSNEATVSIAVYPVNDAPTANAQSVTTDDFTPLAIALTATDIETDSANLTFTIVDAPMHGSLSGTPPNVMYAPNFNYKGPDSFTFTVTDRGDPDNCGAPSQTCADAKMSPNAIVSITVTDGTPPQTLITALKPASLSNDRNPSFGFSATDNVADASALSFECNLDYAVEWTLCGTAGNPTTSYSNLADGSHTFQVRGKDDSGNVDPNPPSYTWTIDATPPDTIITSEPPALATSSMASFDFQSSENNSTLSCSLDGAPGVDCSAGTKAYTGLGDGPHTFTVTATDQAGNVDPTPASYAWNIDTTAPQTNIDSQPTNPTTNTSASFTFHDSDPTGQDTFECSLDGAPFAACASPKNYNGLALGNHSFAVRAKDSAGNMDASPATYSWTIGAVTLENYTMDTDFKRFDGFDVVFGKGTGSYLKINSTNPDSFHYQIKLTNNSGAPIGPAYGNTGTAIITVPGMPSSCGGVACSSQIGSLADPAFIVRGKKVVHLTPGHDRDDDDDDDMPVTIQYKSSGSCDVNSGYSSTLPSNGAAKCIKVTGFSIPVKHSARVRINFQFRLKGTDGWNATAQQLFYAGFIFRATTAVSFGPNTQTATDSTGIVGAGSKATAIGGYAFNNVGSPLSGYAVRIFGKITDASCTSDSKLVAQDIVNGNGFYYVWRTGSDQHIVAPNLPAGVQYAVQLCNGSSQIGLQRVDSKLRDKEFEQIDFNP